MSTAQTVKPADSQFQFDLGGIHFTGSIEDSSGLLRLSADLGGLPFSAEDRTARQRWQAVLEAADPGAADHHALSADRRIQFRSTTKVESPQSGAPLSGAHLIEVLTVVLLTLRNRLGAPPPVPTRRSFRAEQAG